MSLLDKIFWSGAVFFTIWAYIINIADSDWEVVTWIIITSIWMLNVYIYERKLKSSYKHNDEMREAYQDSMNEMQEIYTRERN